ncbi:MAG: NAD-dependent epimerase/dehydratase family protein [Sphingobacteriaceae bacterium]|nr:MAG: NAD-dependent epimerase/dehydratase family protein [Sphingobacteriaceae bacterium]
MIVKADTIFTTCVIGGNGFIGKAVVEALLAQQRKVIVVGRAPSPGALPAGVTYVVNNKNNNHNAPLREVLNQSDEVINLAYATIPQTSFQHPVDDIVLNLPEAVHLFELAATLPIRKFISVSSGGTVYGRVDTSPITETHSTLPLSPYGITKLAIEKYAHMYFDNYGLPTISVRPSNAFGSGQRPYSGQGFIGTAISSILDGRTITMFGNQGTVRDYLYVADMARGSMENVTKVPKVTVIIPNYNHSPYLPKRIESVLNQIYTDFEVILLDDCSPDNSREIIASYAAKDGRINVVLNEYNSGSTFKQWNKGIGLAKGKYIWIAESDDYADVSFLKTLVAELEKDERVGVAYCDSWDINEENVVISNRDSFYSNLDAILWKNNFVLEGKSLLSDFMSYRNIIPNASAAVIRKSVLTEVGSADETFRLNGDWVFWAKILAVSYVAFVSEKLNYFRQHTNNVRS